MAILNRDKLLTTLGMLERNRDQSPAATQRSFRRMTVRGDAELLPTDPKATDREPVAVNLRDISRGGVGFLVDQPLESGTVWRLSLLAQGHSVGEQAVVIRYTRPLEDGVYLVGGQFCIETGLLAYLGLDPREVDKSDLVDGECESEFEEPDQLVA